MQDSGPPGLELNSPAFLAGAFTSMKLRRDKLLSLMENLSNCNDGCQNNLRLFFQINDSPSYVFRDLYFCVVHGSRQSLLFERSKLKIFDMFCCCCSSFTVLLHEDWLINAENKQIPHCFSPS